MNSYQENVEFLHIGRQQKLTTVGTMKSASIILDRLIYQPYIDTSYEGVITFGYVNTNFGRIRLEIRTNSVTLYLSYSSGVVYQLNKLGVISTILNRIHMRLLK
jgi:hypothetical protein